jgi:glutaconyl-CoA/methylmalonyl-CoA decarboxylase subunit gamma
MRKFLIKVNGISYDVEVEEAAQAAAAAPAPVLTAVPAQAAVSAPPAAVDAPAPAVSAPAAAFHPVPSSGCKVGSSAIRAPMPGTVLDIQVSVGQAVKKNEVLLILEAMKMENEIVSPQEGVIAGIHTSKGSSVNAGDLLISLE